MTFSLDLSARRNTIVDSIIEKQCFICDSLMPPYVFHCSECGKCVAYMDHHCPWINNCVGYYTQKVFFLFNFYGVLTLTYSCLVLTYHYKEAIYSEDEVSSITIVVAMSIFVAQLGLMFMTVVLCDQIVVILNRMKILDRVRVEQKKITRNQVRKRGYENYKETFGGDFSWKWLVPSIPNRSLPVEELYH